jgi:hypothetical protein
MPDNTEETEKNKTDKSPGKPLTEAKATAVAKPVQNCGNVDIPRVLEVLIKKASIDQEFRRILLEKRSESAGEIGLELSPAEATLLNTISADQLARIIDKTTVPKEHRRVFLGRLGVAMLVLLAGAAVVGGYILLYPPVSMGIRIDGD